MQKNRKVLHILAPSVLKNEHSLGREMPSYLASYSVREQSEFPLRPSHILFGNLQNVQPLWEQQHHAALRQKSNWFAESFLHKTSYVTL